MRRFRSPHYFIAAISGAAAMTGQPALAQLGSTLSVESGHAHGAVLHRSQTGQIAFRETVDAHGTIVRQYVNSSGEVYAVTWRGPTMPDIEALLGAHFGRYRTGALSSQAYSGLHSSRVEEGDLIVESSVRLREFNGRAWLAHALPPGVAQSDIE
ncbi:uncharacterized protein DUF2844 [Paraburkholderia sp. BL8N3]|jgi:hypothetical protein|nr:DUF2844 domain-containing protein [Paraburkholderia sp. BL8N3]TCK43945.1 uncharacterized protein DUF2844 [Paraburkholderia sp. BL8N3]